MPLLSVLRDNDGKPNEDRVPDWAKILFPIVVSAVVAYFTSQIRAESYMSRMEEREGNHYLELKSSLDLQRSDTREAQRELKIALDLLRQEVRTVHRNESGR